MTVSVSKIEFAMSAVDGAGAPKSGSLEGRSVKAVSQKDDLLSLGALMKRLPKMSETATEKYMLVKMGLTMEEAAQIGCYVDEHRERWREEAAKSDKELTRRIGIEKETLPRKLVLVMKGGDLRIIVLCEEHRGIQDIGCGCYKIVSRAFDWVTGNFYAFSLAMSPQGIFPWEVTIPAYLAVPLEKVRAIQERVLKCNPFGVLYGARGEVEGFFAPLMAGSLDRLLWKNSLTEEQQLAIMGDCIDILLLFEQKKMLHCDIKPANLLYERRGDKVHVYPTDYGLSREDNSERDGWLSGNREYDPPELIRYREMVSWCSGKQHDERMIMTKKCFDQSCPKHDIWSMGAVLSEVFSTHKDWGGWLERREIRSRKGCCPVYGKVVGYVMKINESERLKALDDENFIQNVFGLRQARYTEPAKESPLHFIWEMLQYDYTKRPTATELHARYNEFMQRREEGAGRRGCFC